MKKNQVVLLFASGMNVGLSLSSGMVSSSLHMDSSRDVDQLQMH